MREFIIKNGLGDELGRVTVTGHSDPIAAFASGNGIPRDRLSHCSAEPVFSNETPASLDDLAQHIDHLRPQR